MLNVCIFLFLLLLVLLFLPYFFPLGLYVFSLDFILQSGSLFHQVSYITPHPA